MSTFNPSNLCAEAAKNGHLDILIFLHQNGCPWDEWTCRKAAENGHIECLKYAHENGCPWNEVTCLFAAKYDNLECLKNGHAIVLQYMVILNALSMLMKMDVLGMNGRAMMLH
jgi:hypothetical protein